MNNSAEVVVDFNNDIFKILGMAADTTAMKEVKVKNLQGIEFNFIVTKIAGKSEVDLYFLAEDPLGLDFKVRDLKITILGEKNFIFLVESELYHILFKLRIGLEPVIGINWKLNKCIAYQ